MTPTRLLPVLLPTAGLLAVWAVRPGVVENAARSPLAWAVAAGGIAAAVGVRAAATRLGASALVARTLSTALVVALLAVVLAPSFRQRTLVEDLPADLLAGPGTTTNAETTGPTVTGPTARATATPGPAGAPVATSAAPSGTSRVTAAPRPATSTPRPAAPPQPTAQQPTQQPTQQPAQQPTQQSSQPGIDRTGRLEGIGHTASGQVHLRTSGGASYLVFDDVDIEGSVGPSVHLVPEGRRTPGGGGVRLGALKAEKGTFSYRLPSTVDLSKGWSVLVWCDPYDTPIAAADPR